MAHDVFISHSSQDKPVGDAVCAALETGSIRCWIAPRDVQPGRSFAGEITRAIQHSKVMVLIFSAHTNTSEQVLREVQLAANSHLHIVQLRIQDVLPNDDLEYYLSTPHWLDALTPPLEGHLERLETSVKALLDMAAPEPAKGTVTPAAPSVVSSAERSSPSDASTAKEPTVPVKPTRATPSQAVLTPITSIPPEETKQTPPERTRWIAAAIGLLVISAVAFFFVLLPRLRHAAVRNNAGVAAIPASPSIAERSPSVTSSAVPTAAASAASPAVGRGGGIGRNPSFAFVDMDRIFGQYWRTKEEEAKINEAKNAAKKEYDARAAAYKRALDEINVLNRQLDAPALSADAKTQKAKERDDKIANVKKMEREINEFRQTREKQLQDQVLRTREAIVGDITAKINELGRSEDNFIIDSSGNSSYGVRFFIFAPTKADMSDRIVSALNDHTMTAFLATRGVRMAVIDMNEVFIRYHQTKVAESKINDAKSAAKKEYDTRAAAYKGAIEEINNLNKQLAAPDMSADAKIQKLKERDDKIANVKKMEREINEFRQTREKQLQDQALKSREDIVKEIVDFINRQYIKDRECIVLDTNGQSVNKVAFLVFWRDLPNLTDEVISGLNEGVGGAESATRSVLAYSDGRRFGLIDMDRAFKALPETKQAQAKVDAAKKKAKTELGAHPDASAQAAKDKEIQSEALEKRRMIVNRIATDVSSVAKIRDLDVIFDGSGKSLNGVPVIINSTEIPDVTAEVIADLGGSE